jgi:2-oxoisovalerate dehydrogenase E2 component (dihydrolipoyl transacylase)
MGARSILMPDVGDGVAGAEIAEWTVQVGDRVKEDQIVAGVMTDKATVEIPTRRSRARRSISEAP